MRPVSVLLLVAALVAALFVPALAGEYTNGIEHEPYVSLQLLGIHPLPEGRFLIVSLAERQGQRYLFVMIVRPDGSDEGAVVRW